MIDKGKQAEANGGTNKEYNNEGIRKYSVPRRRLKKPLYRIHPKTMAPVLLCCIKCAWCMVRIHTYRIQKRERDFSFFTSIKKFSLHLLPFHLDRTDRQERAPRKCFKKSDELTRFTQVNLVTKFSFFFLFPFSFYSRSISTFHISCFLKSRLSHGKRGRIGG